MEYIARIHTDFKEKFGVPRQSMILPDLLGKIVFEEKYRNEDYIRGISEFSHIWLLWEFSENIGKGSKALVRPPKLGGNAKVGVFASRSPFRPNPIGMSCVKLEKIEIDEKLGSVIYVSGIDMVNNTPIYDIKPYIPVSDSNPDAKAGFTEHINYKKHKVIFDENCMNIVELINTNKYSKLNLDEQIAEYDKLKIEIMNILAENIRPAYHKGERTYGFIYKDFNIKFKYIGDDILVTDIKPSIKLE